MDIDAIAKITRTKVNRKALPWVMNVVLKDAVLHPEKDILLISKNEENKVIGFIRLHCRRDKVATLHEIAVLDEFKGQGTGTVLIKEAEKIVKENQCNSIRLKTPGDLIRTHAFYLKDGFNKIGEVLSKKRSLFVFEKQV